MEAILRNGARLLPNYTRAEARRVRGVVDLVAYGPNAASHRDENQLEFDLRIAPQANADHLRIEISGGKIVSTPKATLLMQVENAQLHPGTSRALYEEVRGRELARKSGPAASLPQRYQIEGAYLAEPDGSIAFRIARRHPHTALVIDPRSRSHIPLLVTRRRHRRYHRGRFHRQTLRRRHHNFGLHIPRIRSSNKWPRRRFHRLLHSQNRPHRLRRKLPHLSRLPRRQRK